MAFLLYLYTERHIKIMKIYITDTTLIPVRDVLFDSYPAAIQYLEGISQRAFGQTRRDYMLLLESVGHGYDDNNSVNFVRAMSERFDIGMVREGRKMRCDISSATVFDKEEYGS
jgi:7-cyano-7-deazaguanine synthase in queuosine biosynthesis